MKKTLLSGLFFALIFSSALGQQKAAAPKTSNTPTANTASLPIPEKITSAEGITEYKLANGLKVLLFPDPSKQTITVNITYLVGSRHEG